MVIDQKIGCGLIPPKPDGGGLRSAMCIHCGEPHEILFMHATSYTLPEESTVIWKLKGHSSPSFPVSLLFSTMAQERTSRGEQF